jgi:hypothetical protein
MILMEEGKFGEREVWRKGSLEKGKFGEREVWRTGGGREVCE